MPVQIAADQGGVIGLFGVAYLPAQSDRVGRWAMSVQAFHNINILR